MDRSYLEECFVVGMGLSVAAQRVEGVGAIEKGGQITLVKTQHIAVLLNGILPLVQRNVGGSLLQAQVCGTRLLGNLAVEYGQRITPLLGCLRMKHRHRQQ